MSWRNPRAHCLVVHKLGWFSGISLNVPRKFIMRVVLNNCTFHLIEPEDRRHFSHKGRKGHGHLSLICCTIQKKEILSSKSPASSPWQSCFQSRSFASWADRGKQRLEIAPTLSVRLLTRVNLLRPFRKILFVFCFLKNRPNLRR